MTMFPSAAHRQNHLINKNTTTTTTYGGTAGHEYGGGCGYNYGCSISTVSGGGGGSDLDLMADDQQQGESEINSINNVNDEEETTATGSTSKDNTNNTNTNHDEEMMIKKEEEEDIGDEWLQLSLGSTGRRRRPSDLEQQLHLLPAGSTSSGGGETNLSLTLIAAAPRQQQRHLSFEVPITTAAAAAGTAGFFLQPDERGWALAPMALTTTTTTSHQQYQYQYEDINYMAPLIRPNLSLSMTTSLGQRHPAASGGRPLDFHTGPPLGRMDFRVVDPPPRPHSGVWFILQASQNQLKEPYLPQVPKSYLRIKDGRRTTVGLVIKYLVDKLKLDTQSQIEITCKGQQLLPFLTLQHVRDNIWNRPRNEVVFSPSSTTIIDHLMVLNYGRIA